MFCKSSNWKQNFQIVCKSHYLGFELHCIALHCIALFIAYENDEWCHFVVCIDSPALISFLLRVFRFFPFLSFVFLFFFFFFRILLLVEILR